MKNTVSNLYALSKKKRLYKHQEMIYSKFEPNIQGLNYSSRFI